MTMSAERSAINSDQPFKLNSESRFPLDLTARRPSQWEAYETSLVEVWDPEDESLWTGFDPSAHDESHRRAAALVWSHRAWIEFTAIAESEAVLVRACLEHDIEIELKYCLSMRAVERARSTDLCHMLANRLDSYSDAPTTPGLADLLDGELVRRALHSDSDLDAYIAAHLVTQATIDLRLWECAQENSNEALGRLTALVIRDKSRMLGVAWAHISQVVPELSDAARLVIAESVSDVLVHEEYRGRQVPVLLDDGTDRQRLLEAHKVAASAGLGGISSSEQFSVAKAAIDEALSRLRDLGVPVAIPEIPTQ